MLQKLQGNDKGATTYIEKAYTYMVIFFFFMFIMDVILLGATMLMANHQMNYIATKLQFQNGFIGGETKIENGHWDNREIFEYISNGMKNVGIGGDYKWILGEGDSSVNGGYRTIFNSSSKREYTYTTVDYHDVAENLNNSLDGIKNSPIYCRRFIKLSFDYHYRFSGKILYMMHAKTRMSVRTAYSLRYV